MLLMIQVEVGHRWHVEHGIRRENQVRIVQVAVAEVHDLWHTTETRILIWRHHGISAATARCLVDVVEQLVLVAMATVATASSSTLALASCMLWLCVLLDGDCAGLLALKVVTNAHLPLFDLLELLLQLDLEDLAKFSSLAALNSVHLVICGQLHFGNVHVVVVYLAQWSGDEVIVSKKLELNSFLSLDFEDTSGCVSLSDDDIIVLAYLDALLDAVDVINESLLLGVNHYLAHSLII